MPYLTEQRKKEIEEEIFNAGSLPVLRGPGELNYVMTRLMLNYMEDNGLGYSTINDVIGAAEGAKLEFYRRFAADYEDTKILENGDVY
jgi:hypothetical protein